MRIAVLGPLAVWAADGSPLDVRGSRLRALLVRLALDAGRPVGIDTLIDALWGNEAPSANALQSLISRLRGILPPTESGVSIDSGPAGYRLTIDPDAVDALQFEELVRTARGAAPDQAEALLTKANRLWRGEALADLRDAPFATQAAARLEDLRLTAIESLSDTLIATGRTREVTAELERLSQAHPLRERLHELMIRALYADGRQAEALTAYERVRTILADELGTDPSTRLREIHLAMLKGEALDPVPSPVDVPAAPRAHNLRAPLTSFVGRSSEVAELRQVLANGTRLVTLIGPGGAGKTRLVTETGRALVEHARDGIWFIELAPLADAADVAPTVLSALGASEFVDGNLRPGLHIPMARAASARLVEVIADRQVLIVLDNCEHLVNEVAALVDALLASCPRLVVLTTSREPLAIPGEHLHPVGPLGLPPEDSAEGTPPGTTYPSVELFVDRARAVRPDFALNVTNGPAVAEICRRLDGMPLAIELAAARLRALTPAQIVDRLTDRFRLLTSGSRTALPRHQTLRAVVEWSWDLLEPAEQAVARRLSVFSGGATLEAAEQVCSGAGLPPEAVLTVLASLVDKSLVEAAADDRTVRYRMLETVKAFSAEQLEASGETDVVRQAHTKYFRVLTGQAQTQLHRADQLIWIARLDADNENLLGALRNAIDTGDARTAVGLVSVLGYYWNIRGRPTEALSWFEHALAVPGEVDPVARATAVLLYSVGNLSSGEDPVAAVGRALRGMAEIRSLARRHEVVAANGISGFTNAVWAGLRRDRPTMIRALEAVRADQDPWNRAMATMMQAMFNENEGNVTQMAADLELALKGFEEIGDRWGKSLALRGLATYNSACGDHRAALKYVSASLDLMAELGTTDGVPNLLTQRARSRGELGDVEGATDDLRTAIRLSEETGSASSQAFATTGLSTIARQLGDLDEALRLGELAYSQLDLPTERMAPHGQAWVMGQLAMISAARGELEDARIRAIESLRLVLSTEDMPLLAGVVESVAAVAIADEDPDGAARLLGLCAAVRGMRTAPDRDARRTIESARAAVGDATYEQLYEAGAATPREDALAELSRASVPIPD
ncbi:winged helix-turn-helix domain-containing protein [Kribbella sp. NBC_01245]|uniref:BTAD domain-containing putative transcriptional regulator n=1 Tax=Kribbella sp. NBC_01245 TaxID=2903578 RepID=UPI002E2A8B13|nr:BTAD domain-containing putative transcriptional regulator [Kribbella sp. NBC_01245]